MSDLYPRPSRDVIAEMVTAKQPKAAKTTSEPQAVALRNFAVHLSAKMRALGWDQAKLQEKAGIGPHVAARAINGTACEIGVAEKIATLVGGYLATMIGPYACSTCAGEPPKGYACLECGTEARAA